MLSTRDVQYTVVIHLLLYSQRLRRCQPFAVVLGTTLLLLILLLCQEMVLLQPQ